MLTLKKFTGLEGFTLIELSIVLIVIGLVIGGVIIGRDLVNAAELSATISQIGKYNNATSTFRYKYGGLPGDLTESVAASAGFLVFNGATAPCTTVGQVGCGDGNGLIEGATGGSGSTRLDGEVPLYFRHLTDAALIDGSYGTITPGAKPGTFDASLDGTLGAVTGSADIGSLFPAAKLQRGNYITVASALGLNYFIISGTTNSSFKVGVGGAVTASSNNITAIEAYNMDKKIDDGLPGSGSVFALDPTTTAISSGSAGITTESTQPNCINGTAYAISPGTLMACSLRFNFN